MSNKFIPRIFLILLLAILVLSNTSGAQAANSNGKGKNAPAQLKEQDWEQIKALMPASTYSQKAYLKASNTESGDIFGWVVAVSDQTVVVGAPNESSSAKGINGNQADNSADFAGAVYVFVQSGGVWSQQAYLKASNTNEDDVFGGEVAISGNTIVVGAIGEDSNTTGVNGNQNDNTAIDSGAAYVFVRSGTTWTQQAYLKASNTGAGDAFGAAVSIYGDTVVVGATGEDSNATGINGTQANESASASGAVYVFTRSGTAWSQQAYIKASNTGANDKFGSSAMINVNSLVVGSPMESSNATTINGDGNNNLSNGSGAAYVFTRSGSTWSQQAYFKASNNGVADHFGLSVAISGDRMVVGAPDEDGSAKVINGPDNDAAKGAGAAYAFSRSGSTWTQEAYLKASNAEADDNFGLPVALADSTLVVGASGEDSNATTIDGDQEDNSAPDSGAAYIFTHGNSWSQQAYVKTANSEEGDNACTYHDAFMALSDGLMVVGACAEDSNATGVNGNAANNNMSSSGAAYIFDIPSGVSAIERLNPNPTSLTTLDYSVTFSKAMTGVDMSDFALTATGINDASITGITGSGSAYTVTINAGTTDGELRLDLIDDDTIKDINNTPLGGVGAGNGSFTSGEVYTIDRIAPSISSVVRESFDPTADAFLTFTVTFSEAVKNVDTSDFTLDTTGVSGAAITGISGSGTTYFVTLSRGSGNGTIRMDVLAGATIDDLAENDTTNLPYTSGETYTIDESVATSTTTPTRTPTKTHTPIISKTPTPSPSKTATQTKTATRTRTPTITPTPTRTPVTTLKAINSTAGQDGWILETTEISNKGGTKNSTGTSFNVGDDAAKKQYRVILSFNTSSLPDNAVITKVTLKLKKRVIGGGGNPITMFQGFVLDMKKGFFGTSAALEAVDFQNAIPLGTGKNFGPYINPSFINGFYNFTLANGGTYINKLATNGGVTQIRVRFKLDDNNNATANFISLFSGNHTTAANRPKLMITYYVP